ncbi:MAG TPA: response regulator transcription factor [Nitrospirota bacterium]|nr:response regulator transcription factor [Nitrospirota bacterium]
MVNTKIRIMIVDNDSGQIETLSSALKKQEDFEIISVVSTRETAIKLLSQEPDILILNPDVLKQRTLSRFLHSVQLKSPKTRIINVLSNTPPDENAITDIKAGIRGYIKITDVPAIIAKAIRSIREGGIWAERRILEKAIAKPMLLPETLQSHIPGLPPLTNREMEMLTLVLQGATNREIADKSKISERTVKTHLYRVYRKLKVKSRTKAIALLSHS